MIMEEKERRERMMTSCMEDEFLKKSNKDEGEFELKQSKVRSRIRLLQGRPKPIDLLAKYIDDHEDGNEVSEKMTSLFRCKVEELEELKRGIELYVEFDDASDDHVVYWRSLLVLCGWYIQTNSNPFSVGSFGGIHSSVEGDVRNLLQSMRCRDLEAIQSRAVGLMSTGEAKIVEFWETLLKLLPLYITMARLKKIHAVKLRTRRRNPNLGLQKSEGTEFDSDNSNTSQLVAVAVEGEEESVSCKLIKPKFVYRVHSGYQWNKYNRTHYDHDCPPPKTVQGYQFEVFYPGLLDNNKAPTFFIEKDGDGVDTCIIRFHGGSPYEDIAFRVVNRDWDRSPKRGFWCTFDKGVLRLHFYFKRCPYRR